MGKRGRSKKSIFLEISRVEKQLHVKYMAFGFLKFPRKNSLLKTAHVHFFRLSKKVHVKYRDLHVKYREVHVKYSLSH